MDDFEDRLLAAPILAVDDREENLLLLEEMLRQRGYSNVRSTSDPFAVEALHREQQFALILLDMQMPGLDGLGVMQRLRQHASEPFLPVLVITAQTDAELRLKALSSGARDYVSKPFVVAELAQRIRNLLEIELAYRDRQRYAETLEAQVRERTQALLDSEAELERKVEQRTAELATAEARTREVLHNILPRDLVAELMATGKTRTVRHDSATVLFTDFAGFTQAASTMPADQMVSELNDIFARFDDICDACGVEKIKTIGDAYMAVAGVPSSCPDHAQRAVRVGLQLCAFIARRNLESAFKWNLRVGLHTGPVVAGVVGKRKYAFDVWGDTVNIASRMESSGEMGRVNVSAYTAHLIQSQFTCDYRGKLGAKGKGEIDMYFVVGEKRPTA